MKQTWLVGAVMSVMLVASATAQTQPTTRTSGATAEVPSGQTVLGTVNIPRAVMADGKPLSAGRYTVRLTADTASTPAPGATQALERWVEFVQGGQVRGRELASIVPAEEVSMTMPGPDMPGGVGRTGSRVEMLKGGEFLRVWIARGGHNYLIHLPPSGAAK
jgi:hypothetical protein